LTDVEPSSPELPPQEICNHCHLEVPVGAFCGNCGAHLSDETQHRRLSNFAAAPNEHVGHVAVISTLFPHLPHRHAHAFRQALVGGVIIVIALAALRLYAPATVMASILLPVLYLLYLYEVEVYEEEPVLVIGVTFVFSLLLGVGYTLVIDRLLSPTTIDGHSLSLVVQGVVLPLVIQSLMLLGPLILLARPRFDEALDGLTFGVASALGFTLGMTLSALWHGLTAPLLGDSPSADEILRLLRPALIAGVVNASATGVITATLWVRRHGRSAERHRSSLRGLPAAIVAVVLVQIGLGFAAYYVADLLLLVGLWTLAAMALLLYLRVVLHHALLDEGREHALGPMSACEDCHRMVPAMRFCPACGVARSAASKRSRSSVGASS
jgi:predicted amidophosphoribosyltransferase